MFRSSVLVFLALMLCLPAGLCQTASAPATADQAAKAVTDVQEFTEKVLKNVQNQLQKAVVVKKTVEAQKEKADIAASAVAAAAAEAEKGNKYAEPIAQKAKDEMVKCDSLYIDAKNNAENAFSKITGLVSRANELVEKAKITIPTTPEQSINYTEVVEKTKTITAETGKLTTDISSASTVWHTAVDALVKLKYGAIKVQIIKYQADSIFNLSKIQSMLKEAKACIGDIEKKRDGIDATVQKMETILGSAPATSTTLKPLCDEAKVELQKSSNNLNDANKCNESMFWQEAQVKKDIATFNVEISEYKAKQQAYTVEWHTNYTEEKLGKIKQTLQSAETSFTRVNDLHQQMIGSKPQNNRIPGSELNTENTNVDVPTADVTTPIQSGEAAQPKTPNTDKLEITETDKQKTPNTDKPGIPNTDKSKTPNTEKPEITKTDKPEITNSELLNNGKLHMMSKNLTKELLNGEKVLSAVGAKSENAMTVSIPLLVTLIVSAVLH